jgi:hypothetical protein
MLLILTKLTCQHERYGLLRYRHTGFQTQPQENPYAENGNFCKQKQNYMFHWSTLSRDSAFGIATGYGLDD